MPSFDRNTPLDSWELDYISNGLYCPEFSKLGQNLCIGTPSDLVRQYMENEDAPREMLYTWHANQDPAKERRLMVKALNGSGLHSHAETVQMGKCRRTLQEGRSTDQHHATGKAVVSNLNTGAPLDDLELNSVSKQPGPQELLKLSPSSETPSVKLARQYEENADPCSEMLNTRHSNQDQAKERGSQKEAFNESTLDCLAAEKVQMGRLRALQPSSASNISSPRKRTQTQTLAGHETNTPGASQPSSAPYHSHSKVRTVGNPPQQPNILPMRIPQQTTHEITEIKLRDVSNKLGAEWKMVGTYLGFSSSQIEVMQEENRFVKECIFKMLLQWRNSNGVKATKKKLKKVLRRSLREDLVDFIDESDHESQ